MDKTKKKLLISVLLLLLNYSLTAQVRLKVGDMAPDFTTHDPKGKELRLSDLKGKIVMLDFWASWCMPCRMANPEVVELYERFNPQGFEVFSISLDAKKDAWIKAIQNDELKWPYHGSDLKGWENAIAQLYGVEGIPATFLINEEGVIIGINLNETAIAKKLNHYYFEQVNMFPKITNNWLYFTGRTKVVIQDSTGTVVIRSKSESLDLGPLPEGTYTAKFENRTETFYKKASTDVKVDLYPGTVTDTVTLSRQVQYEVINKRGQVALEGNASYIDMSRLAADYYYINLEGDITKVLKK